MNIQELRVGNYLLDSKNNMHEITYFDGFEIGLVGCSIYIKYARPMPITSELLFKLGFVGHHDNFHNEIMYLKPINDTEFEWGVYPNELGSGIQIKSRVLLKYVHQLQNLHFAITGEELIFKN